MIVVQVGDLVIPLVCKRCGYSVAIVVGDDASEGKGAAEMQIHDVECRGKRKEQAS